MTEEMWARLATVLIQSEEQAQSRSIDFREEFNGVPETTLHTTHRRLSIISANLSNHVVFNITPDSQNGRIKIKIGEEGPFLIKQSHVLLPPVASAPLPLGLFLEADLGTSPLVAYEQTDEGITLYQGRYERVKVNGEEKDRIVGELEEVWTSIPESFDQGGEDEWILEEEDDDWHEGEESGN